MIVDVSHSNDFQAKIKNGISLVDFWAPWCGPCRMLSSVLIDLDQSMGDKIQIIKVNVDEATDLSSSFDIQSIPAVMLFKDSTLIAQKTGFLSKTAIVKWLTDNGVQI